MISSVFARLLYRELTDRGFSERALLQHTQLQPQQLWSTPALPTEDFLQFLRNTRQLVAPEPLGFLVAALHRTAAVNMTGLAMTSAPTLRDGLQAMSSYSVLQAEYVRIALRAGRHEASLVLQFDPLVGDCRDIHTEAVLSLLQNYLENMVGASRARFRFSITGTPPSYAAHYEKYLHGETRFEQTEDALHLPIALLDAPSPFADPDLWTLSRQHLTQQLARATKFQRAPFSRHLQTFFAAHTPPLPELTDTAASLHLSPRTLNRRLSAESTTFRELRLAATHEWARRLLTEGLSVEAVALQLGYDNPANFRRSFRSSTGLSPSQWLRQQGDRADSLAD